MTTLLERLRRWWCRRRHRGYRLRLWTEGGLLYVLCGECPRQLPDAEVAARRREPGGAGG